MKVTLDAICQFARVLHVRDLFCAYASISSSAFLRPLPAPLRATGACSQPVARVQGHEALVPLRHEQAPAAAEPWRLEPASAASASRGAAVGGCGAPPSSLVKESVANAASSGNQRARMCTHRARATRKPANRALCAISQKERVHSTGTVIYLMITVPIDTTFIINNLQQFNSFSWCQIMLFLEKISIAFSEMRFATIAKLTIYRGVLA